MQEVKEEKEVQFHLISKPRIVLPNTTLSDFLDEIQALLDEFVDIIFDEFPNYLAPIRGICHHIDLIPSKNLPKKAAYNMTPKQTEEIKNQVQELLNK